MSQFGTQEKRKPVRSSKSKFDNEGFFSWFIEGVEDYRSYTNTAKIVHGATIATCMNMQKIIRRQNEYMAGLLLERLDNIGKQLDQIESKIDGLLERASQT